MRRTSLLDFSLQSLDFLLLDIWCIWVEASKLLVLLPCQHAVWERLVLLRWHHIFFNLGDIGVVGTRARRSGVGDLDAC